MQQENTFPKELIKSQFHLDRYIRFIDSRPIRLKKSKDLYLENHHKVPKALGGTNKKENMILLTAREHYIAHMMLYKAFGEKMLSAFYLMTNIRSKTQKITARMYEKLKKEFGQRLGLQNKTRKPEKVTKG